MKTQDEGDREKAPIYGVQGTNKTGEVSGGLGVIPEAHPNPPEVKGPHSIFCQSGQQAAGDEDGHRVGLEEWGHVEDDHSTQAVHRAQREKEKTLSSVAASAQELGIEDLQK